MENNERTAAGRCKLLLKYPASWWKNMWREALPAGNGTTGASVFGGVKEETILLHHTGLWHWGRKDPLPDVSHTLAETRKLMDQRKYAEASWHLSRTLTEQGYAARLASRFPLAAMQVTMPGEHAFRHYRRVLDMETGEVTVSWQDGLTNYRRRLFVSRSEDIIAYEIESSGHHLEGEIALQLHPSERWSSEPEYQQLEQSVEVRIDGPWIYYAGRNDDGSDFGAVLRLVSDEDCVAAESGDGRLAFKGTSKVLFLVKLFIKGRRSEDWKRLRQLLSAAGNRYDQLLDAHTELHKRLFHSAGLELYDESGDEPFASAGNDRSNEELLLEAYEGEAPAALVQKLWAYGRYLFISGTSEDSLPFGLYGLWGGDYRLVWGHNMANENIQMIYWHANVGGLSSLAASLFRYYEDLLDDFRDNARKLYGCKGIYIPAGSTPGIGVPNQIVPVIMNWTGAAGWLARHYVEHYRYTGDIRFLQEKAVPFMQEAIQFYEDFLVEDEDGYFKIYPSVSPENTPQNHMPESGQPLAHPMPSAINATMDFAILKELLTHLLEAGEITGMDTIQLEKWKGMLSKIPPYQINEEGAIKEWMHPEFVDRYNHRHLSHLYPVFPGQEVIREEQPELFKAFETAVRKRLIGAQSGWSLAHMAAIYARLGAGDQALECLDILARSCLINNFFTLHNDWRQMGICMDMPSAPVQLDANMGWVNAVQELLLYASPKLIKVLPALPARWIRGRVRDWRYPGGKLSLVWDKASGLFRLELSAERPTDTTLKLPPDFNGYTFSSDAASQAFTTFSAKHGCCRLQLEPGQRLIVHTAPIRR
ncbi:glycosyl hydrolase family 95 catalytic domain-containing protein [Paenibacillus senegalensis]|uniref:glycosyl hydrolase family 95 catalytic domain-containing protein n=1 Tax=Paenibacillus senegalensis TaxID=1465766 RepID=UPI0002882A9B|nr:glycoside hydrolase N-terminal domain-containing protein [Paenibacillus senegalensis]